MNAQQRLGRLIIALATLAGLAGFIANQIIFFQTHPTQAPEVYALTAIILVIVVLLGLLGGVLVTHGTQVVRRLQSHARHVYSPDQQGASSSPASELRHTWGRSRPRAECEHRRPRAGGHPVRRHAHHAPGWRLNAFLASSAERRPARAPCCVDACADADTFAHLDYNTRSLAIHTTAARQPQPGTRWRCSSPSRRTMSDLAHWPHITLRADRRVDCLVVLPRRVTWIPSSQGELYSRLGILSFGRG